MIKVYFYYDDDVILIHIDDSDAAKYISAVGDDKGEEWDLVRIHCHQDGSRVGLQQNRIII